MPRRIHTHAGDLGFNTLNLITSILSFVFALGVLVFVRDVIRHLRDRPLAPRPRLSRP